MIIYVITEGYYNQIIGAVESEEEAKEIARCYRGTMDNDVQITKCDTKRFETKNFAFKVERDYENEWTARIDNYYDEKLKGFERVNAVFTDDEFLIFAKTIDEAIKLAQDMRIEVLAKKNSFVF